MRLEGMLSTRGSGAEWHEVKFADIAEHVSDRIDDPTSAGVERYVGLEHLRPRELCITRWGSPNDVTATKLLFRPGDIIFGKRRAYQRKLAQADFTGICSAHAMVLRARPDVMLPELLPFFMDTDAFFARALSISVGSLSPTINWKALAAERFPIPSLAYQEAALRVLKSAQSTSAASSRASSAAEVVTRRLRDDTFASNAWPTAQFVDVCVRGPHNGLTVPKQDRGGAVGMVNMGELFADEVIDMNDLERVDLSVGQGDTYILCPGDLLFARRSIVPAGAGTCSLVPEHAGKATFESSLIRATLDASVALPEFILHYFRSASGRAGLRSITRLGAVTGIAGSDLKRLQVPLPTLDQQRDAVTALAKAQRAARALTEHASRCAQLRIALSEHLLTCEEAIVH